MANYTIQTKKDMSFSNWLISNRKRLQIKYSIGEWEYTPTFYLKKKIGLPSAFFSVKPKLWLSQFFKNLSYKRHFFEIEQKESIIKVTLRCHTFADEYYTQQIKTLTDSYLSEIELQGFAVENINVIFELT
jgi:hypothetical protein